MAEDGASLPAHVCGCGISFGSILDPPDDNASDHCLTFPLGPSDLHKDWESDLQNDWGPANIVNPSEDWLDKLGSDLGSHNLTYLPIAKAGLDTKAGLDATDGCFSDVGFKIIKAATVVLLEHLIGDKLKEDCEGCAIDHPSQLQHSCLFDPPNFYFDTHFDELSGKLFKPFFHSIIGILLNRCGLKSHPHRIQGTVGTILHELKDEPFIVAKLEEIRLKLLDKPCKEIVYDVVDLWQGLSIVNGERPSQLQHGCSL